MSSIGGNDIKGRIEAEPAHDDVPLVLLDSASHPAALDADSDEASRRSGGDRRGRDRRRSRQGLFEIRARRDGIVSDRRQGDRRMAGVSPWYLFWRRA